MPEGAGHRNVERTRTHPAAVQTSSTTIIENNLQTNTTVVQHINLHHKKLQRTHTHTLTTNDCLTDSNTTDLQPVGCAVIQT